MRTTICILVLLSFCRQGIAESLDERFLAGLRERRLYRLAEEFGNQRWQRDDLTDRERAALAVQLAALYTEHALAAPAAERDALWNKAEQICAEFSERWSKNPQRQLVEVQAALVALARGQQLRQEASGDAAALAPAIEQLRTAAWRLEGIAKQVEQRLIDRRMRPNSSLPPDALSTDELESLSRNVSLQLARALREQAMCFPVASADRDDALLQAVGRLEPLAQQASADALAWQARVETIACLRELGRLQPAANRYAAWIKDEPPTAAAARLAAEQVRVLLAAGKLDAALQLADQAAQSVANNRDAGGELALARVEVLLEQWRQSSPTEQKSAASELMQTIESIRSRYGLYWARRAELLAGRALAATGPTGDADSLLLAARHLYHSGRIDESVAAYDRAARHFAEKQQPEQAFDAQMSAAAIERSAGQLTAAAERYRQLALSQLQHSRAAEAHALAILSTADKLRGASDDEMLALANTYEAMLAEHLDRWTNSSKADDVRWWLGSLLARRSNWQDAMDLLQQVPPDSPHYEAAIRTTVDGYEAMLTSPAGDANQRSARANMLAAATTALQPIITGPENRWPAEWSKLQRDVALALARLHVRYGNANSPYAQQLLTAALRGSSTDPTDEAYGQWQSDAESALVVARVRSGRATDGAAYDDALARYAELSRQHPDDGEIQEGYAMLLAQSDSEESLTAALAQWRQIEQHSRRGGPRWRRARQARIELLTKLNRRDEAEKLLRLTQLLYPDWNHEPTP